MDRSYTTEEVWHRFQGRLRSFILRRVRKQDEADDILQEVFMKIHLKIDTLNDYARIEVWLYQLTRNTIIDHYRRKKPEFVSINFEVIDEIDEITALDELAPFTAELIDLLPKHYRDTLKLTEIMGMTQKKAGQKLGISLAAVKSRVLRGREYLKKILMTYCHLEFDQLGTVAECHPICDCFTRKDLNKIVTGKLTR